MVGMDPHHDCLFQATLVIIVIAARTHNAWLMTDASSSVQSFMLAACIGSSSLHCCASWHTRWHCRAFLIALVS